MNSRSIVGTLLLIGGIAAAVYGLSIQGSMEYKIASAFGGDTSRVAVMVIFGGIVAIIGLILLLTGLSGKKNTEYTPRQHPAADEAPDIRTEIRQYDEAKLREIVENSGSYRLQIVDECRRELEIRQKSEAFIPKVKEYPDDKLHEILSNPQLYADELIYACAQEQNERWCIMQEQQEREAEQMRIEREKAEAEARVRRIAIWKKRRPYVFGMIVILVVTAACCIYYAYEKKQEKERLERIAWETRMEEQRILEEQRVAAEQKQAEEQRIAAGKKREQERIAAEHLELEGKKIVADENYRRSVGAYLVGEYHEGLDGIVFSVDKTYKHGKVISKKEFPSTSDGDWDATNAWCKSLGKGWRLPTIQEWEFIYKQENVMNELSLTFDWYRSASKWTLDDHHWRFHTGRGERYGCPDTYGWIYARAVSEF